jgi:hypothetical protein
MPSLKQTNMWNSKCPLHSVAFTHVMFSFLSFLFYFPESYFAFNYVKFSPLVQFKWYKILILHVFILLYTIENSSVVFLFVNLKVNLKELLKEINPKCQMIRWYKIFSYIVLTLLFYRVLKTPSVEEHLILLLRFISLLLTVQGRLRK